MQTSGRHSSRFSLVLCALALVAGPSVAATFTVNDLGNGSDFSPGDGTCEMTNGGADCSFRAAIQEANSLAGADIIEFSIMGCGGVCTIANPQLPTITEQVTIDGYSQPGALPNGLALPRATNATLMIEIAPGVSGCIDISHLTSPTDLSEGTVVTGLVISGCNGDAISMDTPYNTIQGNFLGTTADGSAIASNDNAGDGIGITFSNMDPTCNNLIGGLPDELNLISGNGGDGININCDGNLVLGNIVGTDALGLTDLGSAVGDDGIVIDGDDNEIGADLPLIGGLDLAVPVPTLQSGNLVSGHRFNGILVTGDDNYIVSNVVGVNRLHTAAIPNDNSGIRVDGTGNSIGILGIGFDQIVAGNGDHGIFIGSNGANDNTVAGNLVGIVFDGIATYGAMGNGCDGIRVATNDNTIGGALIPGQGNWIGDSGTANCGLANGPGHGIVFISNATDNKVVGNSIGLDPNGISIPNAADGIALINNAQNIQIGDGTDFGANLIGPNGMAAGNIAIDIDNDGHDTNDPLDVDTGLPNEGQNYPVITSAVTSGGATTISGTLNSNATQTYIIQIFSSLAGQTDQARSYEGSVTTAATNASGDVAWSFMASFPLPSGTLITATATPEPAMMGDVEPTSELSDSVAVIEPGELQFTMMNYTNTESGMATIAVERVNGSDGMVSVQYATADGSATNPADYTSAMGMVAWNDGDSSNKTFDVPIAADTIDELDETVNLSLSGPTGGATLGMPTAAVLTIQDDDAPPQISISDVSQVEGNVGNTNFDFAITLDTASGLQVDVDYATADGTATLGDTDYVMTNGTVTFLPSETMMIVSVPVVGDVAPESDENFFVDLTMPMNASIADNQGEGMILDDDTTPEFSVDDVLVVEGDVGTTTLTFTVSLSPMVGSATSVDVATADSTATAPADYVAITTTTVNFPANTASVPVMVTINNDVLDEVDEVFFLDLTNAQGGTGIADAQGVGTIQDNDAAPGISIDDVSLPEGNAGTTSFDFNVTLDAPSGQIVTVDFMTADGTATLADNDYQTAMGMVSFMPGDTSEAVSVLVNGDGTSEANEDFSVNLTNGSNGMIVDGLGVGTIQDDDSGPVFSIDDVSVLEGDAGTVNATFTVTLMPAAAGPTTIDVATMDGSATGITDYGVVNTTLSFAAGVTSQPLVVVVNGDTTDEVDETYFVDLSNPTGGAGVADPQGLGTILDDDPVPSASIQDVSQVEGNAGMSTFDFPVTLSEASGQTITIDYATMDGTATTADMDYVATMGTLTFLAGDTVQMVSVTVNGDGVVEPSESFTVDLSMPVLVTLSDAQGVGTIVDDDGMPQAFIDDVTLAEGDAGTTDAVFTISLSTPPAVAVSVDYATSDGTATAGSDYQSTSGTANFPVGATTVQVMVPVIGDLLDEFDETFFVDLSNPVGVGIADNQGNGTITDDDPLPDVSVPTFAQAEGDAGMVTFDIPVTLSAASGKT
ncbi:MAG: hypothetical protein K8J08_04820, partial [Thermoanaerobaculia bacterium]|nr:hypothetical protein [Thermoanaerobaculia bacterium]